MPFQPLEERMTHLENSMGRVETTLYGPDDEPHKGLVTRSHETSRGFDELRSDVRKCVWLLIATVIGMVLNLVMRPPAVASGGAQNHTSIMTGQAKEAVASHKEYLTTKDVAEIEKVSERTITNWISQGVIMPPPVKQGKEFVIAANYRKIPQMSAPDGTTRN